jgi:hypothetical protein
MNKPIKGFSERGTMLAICTLRLNVYAIPSGTMAFDDRIV